MLNSAVTIILLLTFQRFISYLVDGKKNARVVQSADFSLYLGGGKWWSGPTAVQEWRIKDSFYCTKGQECDGKVQTASRVKQKQHNFMSQCGQVKHKCICLDIQILKSRNFWGNYF